ncbi:MAG: CbiX/SirB N-terminal domain-containing protein, partial [Nocardioidaceae bacterium]
VVPLLCGRERALTETVALEAGAALADPLGGQRLLSGVLAQRLREAGARTGQPVVLVAAGCVEPSGQGETTRAAQLLEEVWGGPVRPAHLTGRGLRLSQVVTDFRDRSAPTPAVVPLLVSHGQFHDRMRVDVRSQGLEVCAGVLGDHPQLAEAAARSYRATVARRFALSLV